MKSSEREGYKEVGAAEVSKNQRPRCTVQWHTFGEVQTVQLQHAITLKPGFHYPS